MEWLDQDENLDKWFGPGASLSVRERRVLITRWVGNSYEKLMRENCEKSRMRFFQKTGYLITADGSEASEIQPEGLPTYVVPLVSFASPLAGPLEPTVPDPMSEETAIGDPRFSDDEEYSGPCETEIPERFDDACDRDHGFKDVGRSVKALYENGWHIGTIEYYNKILKEFRVNFSDGSVDYISLDEIGDPELYFVWLDVLLSFELELFLSVLNHKIFQTLMFL